MQITVEMIDTKEFKIKPRGYDQQEVDDFLDAIGDEMVRQLDTIQSLQQQLQHLLKKKQKKKLLLKKKMTKKKLKQQLQLD